MPDLLLVLQILAIVALINHRVKMYSRVASKMISFIFLRNF